MSPRPIVFVVEKQTERGMGADDLRLVEQREFAGDFEHALNDEHHIGAASVVLIEHKGGIALQRERQDALAELRHLLAVLQHDRVLADEIDAADVAVEVDADAGPVEACGHLLDVRRLAGAVVALHHHPAVVLEAGQDRQGDVPIEQIIRIEIRHMLTGLGIGRNLEITVDPEHLPDGQLHVGKPSDLGIRLRVRAHLVFPCPAKIGGVSGPTADYAAHTGMG